MSHDEINYIRENNLEKIIFMHIILTKMSIKIIIELNYFA